MQDTQLGRRTTWAFTAVLATVAVAVTSHPAAGQGAEKPALFEKDIAPIFQQHCVKCHGAKPKKAGLDLRTAAAAFAGGESGPVLIPGSADKSVLFEKIASRTMPPPEKKDPLSDQEIALIRKWIDGGAASAAAAKPVAGSKERVVTEKDREYWAFRKPVTAPVPPVKATERLRTWVDAFLLAKLEAKGLTFSPDAAKETLVRRAYLDLIGLPPSPGEVRSFLADTRPDAYERLIDGLLDSPHYGERWGRHWLDVAGYTDAPHCDTVGNLLPIDDWRYRDYVIRSLNDDKPYDRFLTEQLAGDELVDWRSATKFTPEILDALIATGYLRCTPDWTHQDVMQSLIGYSDTLSRVVDSVSTGLIGLTMGCVRCHSHKFDPIAHEDYYRLMAVFATGYNPDQWLRPADRYLPAISPKEKEQVDRHNAKIDARLAEITKRLDEWRHGPHYMKVLAAKLMKLPEEIRSDVEKAITTPAAMRNEIQRYLAEKFEARLKVSDQELSNASSAAERAEVTKLGNEFGTLLGQKQSFTKLQTLWDVGKPPVIRELIRGDARTPGKVVEPGFVTVLCPPDKSAAVRPPDMKGISSGRRLAFARWLSSPEHPLTARVIVNRVWQHHFGKGIVATPENFGHSGTPPTHPELLDWLAVDFMHHGWRIKRLHKQLMTSTAYQQSSRRPPDGGELRGSSKSPSPLYSGERGWGEGGQIDPENDLLWHMNLRRLEAEALRDSVLAVSGRLDRTMGGAPIPAEPDADGLVTVTDKGPTPTSKWRRSLYIRSIRGSHASGRGFALSFFEMFDYPEIVINCTRRQNSTTPLQSLALVNSKFMLEQARYFAERVSASAGVDAPLEKKVEAAFSLAFGRLPTSAESRFCLEHLRTETQLYSEVKSTSKEAAERALTSLCLMLLASNEFLYIG